MSRALSSVALSAALVLAVGAAQPGGQRAEALAARPATTHTQPAQPESAPPQTSPASPDSPQADQAREAREALRALQWPSSRTATSADEPATAATQLVAATPTRSARATAMAYGLRAQVDAALRGSTAAGVSVAIDVAGLGAVERRAATTFRPPATTEKLYTVFAALRLLGPDYQSLTSLQSIAPVVAGHLTGDLYLVAGGDPYLTHADLDGLAAQLAAAGVTAVDGRLLVDDSRYDRVRRPPGWKPGWVPEESGPLSAMAVDGNSVRGDAPFLADPATPAAAALRTYLGKRGVTVGASVAHGIRPDGASVLASHLSAPLSVVVRRIAKDSYNFGAEMLLKELGHAAIGVGTSAAGTAAVRSVFAQVGVSTGTTVDGSGLSRVNLKTAAAELALLRAAERSSFAATFEAALPIACGDGTLKHRLCGTMAALRTFAKTGTLDTAIALTGWTRTADGHRVRFVFLLTAYANSWSVRAAIDRAVVALASARVG